jgi:ATP-dependent DNA ligase
MLAQPDRLPRGDWSYEVKWGGFRAIVSTEDEFGVLSRRGWSMTERVSKPGALPAESYSTASSSPSASTGGG